VAANRVFATSKHRLVEDEHVGILIQRDGFEEFAGFVAHFGATGIRLRGVEPQRRNAHALSSLQPVLRLRALAVDADLAFTDHALDVGEA
jgi:hypothetical protein